MFCSRLFVTLSPKPINIRAQKPKEMKKTVIIATIALAFATGASAAENVKGSIHADQAGAKINREIYGQFSEHLGTCIYGGLWVGENSQIPNIKGYRKDLLYDGQKQTRIQSKIDRM